MPLYFGMFVSVAAYLVGMALKKKLGWAILNPLLVAILLVMALLKATGISYGDYNQGASYISYFLTPATVCLAIPLYKQLELLKKNLAAVLCGITTGVAGSVLSIFAMSLVFRLERVHYVSLLPKSITTAIGMGVAEEAGGIVTITIFNFIGYWNEYIWALVFSGKQANRTLAVALQTLVTSMQTTGNYQGLFAGVVIVFVPTVIIYVLLSKQIMSGATAGAVKG